MLGVYFKPMPVIMPNEPINILDVAPSEWVVLSPAVSNILSQTHKWADKIIQLRKFADEETSLIVWVQRSVLWTLKSSVNPVDMSNIIQMKGEYRQLDKAA